MAVKVKCIYDEPAATDGHRVLVMTFWPRGIRKDKVDDWQKELGTSPDLIKSWKGGKIAWPEFSRRYRDEMRGHLCQIADLAEKARTRTVTLLCGCRDDAHCHRTLLKELVAKAAGATAAKKKSPARKKA